MALIGTSGAPTDEVDLNSPWPEHRWAVERPDYLEPPRLGQLGGASVALAVDNALETIEELRRKGVTILMEPYRSPVCYLALITDPDGNRIWIHQRARKSSAAG